MNNNFQIYLHQLNFAPMELYKIMQHDRTCVDVFFEFTRSKECDIKNFVRDGICKYLTTTHTRKLVG